jgi:hypothetical protein
MFNYKRIQTGAKMDSLERELKALEGKVERMTANIPDHRITKVRVKSKKRDTEKHETFAPDSSSYEAQQSFHRQTELLTPVTTSNPSRAYTQIHSKHSPYTNASAASQPKYRPGMKSILESSKKLIAEMRASNMETSRQISQSSILDQSRRSKISRVSQYSQLKSAKNMASSREIDY